MLNSDLRTSMVFFQSNDLSNVHIGKYKNPINCAFPPFSFSLSFGCSYALALSLSWPQRKLLAIYLHNDESVLSNVFCSQMMCADSIVAYLSQNFITWAWDVTKEANKARYLMACYISRTMDSSVCI